MLLSVYERLVILSTLPPEGNIATMRIVRDLRHDLGFSEEEFVNLHIRTETGRIKWDMAQDKGKEIAMGQKGMEIVKEGLIGYGKMLNAQDRLKLSDIALFEKFGIGEAELDTQGQEQEHSADEPPVGDNQSP